MRRMCYHNHQSMGEAMGAGSGGSPCSGVDIRLIAIVKRLPPYRAIRKCVANPCPSDSWHEEGLAFIVFDLLPLQIIPDSANTYMPQVVFVLDANSGTLLVTRVVEPGDVYETLSDL